MSTSSAAIAQGALAAVVAWAATAISLSEDASLPAGAMSQLQGNYGRYVSDGSVTVVPTATVDSILAAIVTARAVVAAAASAAESQASALTTATAADLVTAISTLSEAVRTAAINPADQIRLMTELADFYPTPAVSSAAIGETIASAETYTAAVCRRAALVSLSLACSGYTPTSYNDAASLCDRVATLLDAEIIVAADAGDGNAYASLRALRTAVITDLTTRAADLSQLVEITTKAPVPALTLAYHLYGDATRCDDITQRANPVCPLWMPTNFEALSS